jgi:Zn-dependent protease with chaperone function
MRDETADHLLGRTPAIDGARADRSVAVRADPVVRGYEGPAMRAHPSLVQMSIVRVILFAAFSFGLFGQPAAPDELRYSPDRMRMAVELRTQTEILHFVEAGWEIAVLALLLSLGVAARLRRRGHSDFVVITAILAIVAAAELPAALYRHSLSLRYGLSIQGWDSWLMDWVKGTALAGIIAVPLIAGGYALARRVREWWMWAWAATVAVMVITTFVLPVVVEPMFNKFRPLGERHPELVPKLEQVGAAAGVPIPPERMFEMDASAKGRTVNAYLTGFGATKRIVLWDTTIATLTPAQIQTVFAHEAGHYVLSHVPKGLAVASAALLLLIIALNRFLGRDAATSASLPKALLFLSVIGFLAEPAGNAYSRWQEHEADVFELKTMYSLVPDEGRNSASVDLVMADINLEHPRPNPFVVWWLYDHPPSGERMRFALQYGQIK